MSTGTMNDRHAEARRRALRAARAVTLGVFALSPAGCASTVSDVIGDAEVDAAGAADAGPTDVAVDAGPTDVAADVPTRCTQDAGTEAWTRCCASIGWDWNRGCEAWGPFVPPAMGA